MRQPAPTERGQVDDALVMSTLANKHQAGTMVLIVNALTTVYPNEVLNKSNDINIVNKDPHSKSTFANKLFTPVLPFFKHFFSNLNFRK